MIYKVQFQLDATMTYYSCCATDKTLSFETTLVHHQIQRQYSVTGLKMQVDRGTSRKGKTLSTTAWVLHTSSPVLNCLFTVPLKWTVERRIWLFDS